MSGHKAHYPTITAPGIAPTTVARLYDVMDRRAE